MNRRAAVGSAIAAGVLLGAGLAFLARNGGEPVATAPDLARPATVASPAVRPRPAPTVASPEAAQVQASLRDFLRELAQASEAREEAARDALLNPPGSEGATIDQRLERFKTALESRTAGIDPALVLPYRGVITEVFLRVEAVQRELAALPPADRAQQIARIRRELGHRDEEIRSLAADDEVKEARWQNGLAYMEERRRVVQTFEGDALEQELAVLRTRYFSNAAPTIEREEQAGFFRFERPRIYGRN